MKDRWLREQTLKLSKAVGSWMDGAESRLKRTEDRWLDLEQRVHDAEQLLYAEIARRGTEEAKAADEADPVATIPISQLAGQLDMAISDENVVMFRYTKEHETEWQLRQLSPYELIEVTNGLVVRGWDHQREGIRSFRLDRIEALTSAYGSRYRHPVTS